MPQFRDFQATVVVDGVELPEYTIQVNEKDGEISCYIPSEVGKSFTVKWRDMNMQRSTVGTVYLDGTLSGRERIVKDSNPREASRSYSRVTSETVRPFCFARLSLTDDESCANPVGKHLGTVRIQLYEYLGSTTVPIPPGWKSDKIMDAVKIHEHSKKAMTHCVGLYGESTKKAASTFSRMVRGKTLATFIFCYRSLEMLQAQGIAPPPPQPSSTQRETRRKRCKEEDIIDLIDVDDGETDEARLKALKAEIGEIETRLLKRQKTVIKAEVKSEDKVPVIANEVIELE